MKISHIFLALFILGFSFNSSAGEIYRWTDDEGNPQMTNSLEKVPKKYRDSVKVRDAGNPKNISISNPPAPAKTKRTKTYSDDPQKSFNGHSVDWWIKTIENLKKEIGVAELDLESKKLDLESHKTTVTYSLDLTRQIKDLKQRLKETRARKVDKKLYPEAKKKKDILYLVKQLKRVQSRKNANLVNNNKKDVIKTSGKEIEIAETEITELKAKLASTMTEAIKAGVPQKLFY